MKVWRMTFKGHYPEYVEDFMAETVEHAVILADKFFKKTGVHIDTKKELVDVILLSIKLIREDELK